MARIFLSHSCANNTEAIALRDWLIAEGWDDLFLDLDPSRGIAAGERWERRLHEAANRCEAVLFLVSRAWLESEWCRRELMLAETLNKRIFGILIEEVPLSEVRARINSAWQLVDLAGEADHQMFRVTLPDGTEAHRTFSKAGLARLKTGLMQAGLDGRFFPWPPEDDPDRPPYRGMRPLEAEDAGIFFGREAQIIAALDRLRGLREATPPRLFVILGASGVGKSSFLRAGLLPRLLRNDRNFLPLQIVRPDRAALTGETGFLRSLEAMAKAHGQKGTRAEVKAVAESGAPAVAALLADLAQAARAPSFGQEARPAPPRIVLAIDQGEELFFPEGKEEADAFLRLVHDLVVDPASSLIVVVTIRSDYYDQLQTAPALDGVQQETLSLLPLPIGSYQMVIEGPAARLADTPRALKIEPALTDALLADIQEGGGQDALPLLALTLERLYLEYGGDGDLRLSEYRQLGGIRGSIEAAVERALKAADADPAVPKDRAARETLLRRALIPRLVEIDPETSSPRRRLARLAEIPEETRPLVEHLIAAGLLATDVSQYDGERTIVPAHEAILRQWSLLQGWLQEDYSALTTLDGIKRGARAWASGDTDAILRRSDLLGGLDAIDHAYLSAIQRPTGSTRQPRRVFVSFSHRDETAALEIVEHLELAGITCWISSRNVPFGADFQDAIVEALEGAGAMVLVFSQNANNSSEIKKELALASQYQIFVLPIRIENVEPSKGFKYQLATCQYIDVFDNKENINLVITALSDHLSQVDS